MWMMTTVGFFSVVQASVDEVMVRARTKEDIERMRAALLKHVYANELRILETMHADYPYRLIVRKELFADYMREAVANIDYGNFKNEVAKTDPHRSHGAYADVWHVLRRELDPRERRPTSILERPVDDLDIGLRVQNALEKAEVRTIGFLCKHTRGQVLQICGTVKCVKEVEKALAAFSLSLATDAEALEREHRATQGWDELRRSR